MLLELSHVDHRIDFFCKFLYVEYLIKLTACLVKLLEYVQLGLFLKAEHLFKFQIYCGLWSEFL